MKFENGLGEQAIQEVLAAHPPIGDILAKHDIGCVTCKVGICLLKDVVSIHALPPAEEEAIENQINAYFTNKGE
jgi:hypothetical protein